MNKVENDHLLSLVTEIVVAFLSQRALEPEQLATLIFDVRSALTRELPAPGERLTNEVSRTNADNARTNADNARAADAPVTRLVSEGAGPAGAVQSVPADAPPQTVFDDYVICLEDGKPYRSLRRHLKAKYGMTPDEYRAKWNLPKDHPMVAPSYARERSEVAKRSGLGRARVGQPKPIGRPRSGRR